MNDTDVDENNKIEHWSHNKPVAPYLMVANASIFDFWSEKVARVNNSADSLVLEYYMWEEVSHNNDDSLFGRKAFETLPEMMTNFSDKLFMSQL